MDLNIYKLKNVMLIRVYILFHGEQYDGKRKEQTKN